jgi:ABC-2 type transport system permease protein
MTVTYLRLELLRTYRNIRYLLLTLGIPVILFLVIGGAFDNQRILGVSGQTWYMINMAIFGALGAVLGVGARIAVERDAGWNRQLRLTPLPGWGYLAVKAATAMLVVLPALLLVFGVAAVVKGIDLGVGTWIAALLTAWLSVLPFAAVGLLIGMAATPDSAQSTSTVVVLLFSILGGVLIPAQVLPAALASAAQYLPSYWIVAETLGQVSGAGLDVVGVLVLLAWLVTVGVLVIVRYRRDALRV